METVFKENNAGHIPKGWEFLPFDYCVDKKGITVKYPKLQTKDYLNKGLYPIIDQGQRFIAGYTNNKDDLYTGRLPVTIFGDHTLFVKFVGIEFAIGADGTVPLYPNKQILTDEYFYYLIYDHKIKSEGYQRHLKYLRQKRFLIPPLPEQRKIAEILSTVDETIDKTDAIIQETRQLKKGLMQKLFSEGIGHTRFKDTKIGRVPEEWRVEKLSEVVELRHGYQFRDYDFTQTGIAVIKIGNLIDGNLCMDDVSFIDANRLPEFENYMVRNGDLLMSLTGNIGRLVEVKGLGDSVLQNYRVGHFSPKGDRLGTEYLKYALSSELLTRQMNKFANQTAQANFGKKDLDKLFLSYPSSVPEQRKIAEILSQVGAKIELDQAFRAELEQLKKGLMQVLLTGKVRVKV